MKNYPLAVIKNPTISLDFSELLEAEQGSEKLDKYLEQAESLPEIQLQMLHSLNMGNGDHDLDNFLHPSYMKPDELNEHKKHVKRFLNKACRLGFLIIKGYKNEDDSFNDRLEDKTIYITFKGMYVSLKLQ